MSIAAAIPAAALLSGCSSPGTPPDGYARQARATTAACADASPDSGEARKVAAAARAFAASLAPDKRALLVHPFTRENAIRWSNYPSEVIPRAGIAFADMTPAQVQAADALILAAAGACGAALMNGDRAADVLGHEINAYIGPAHYYLSFNGAPSETAPWMLMIGGHHLAYNFVFNDREPGATPLFAGSDPRTFVDQTGAQREPLRRQSRALAELTLAVSSYPEARLPGVYTDLVKSAIHIGPPPPGPRPGQARETPAESYARAARTRAAAQSRNVGIDVEFPQSYPTGPTGRGVSYAQLTPPQQALVRRAIEAYAALPGQRLSAPLLGLYEAPEALAQTYVAFSGDPNLEAANAYARIDGPRVWIEMSVQESLTDGLKTHFHSVWRDKLADYGGHFKS